ncbi:MAG: hypothetical protein IPH27_14890 [Actinomycetales bacterium]|nr:hypothetical protein [Candidatus Phosphoribacter baldrii]
MSREYVINHAWLTVVQVAADLLAWLRPSLLPDALKACEPKAQPPVPAHPARLTWRGLAPSPPVATADVAVGHWKR